MQTGDVLSWVERKRCLVVDPHIGKWGQKKQQRQDAGKAGHMVWAAAERAVMLEGNLDLRVVQGGGDQVILANVTELELFP